MRHLFRLTAMVLSVCTLIAVIPFAGVSAADTDFQYTLNAAGDEATVTGYTGGDTNVVIPDTLGGAAVTAIGDDAFAGNTTMQSVSLPDTLVTIGESAFNACTALKAVDFPSSLQTIKDLAFYDCKVLADITITPYTYDIGYQAFHNTAWYLNADAGVLYLGRVLYGYAGPIPKNTVITVKYGTAAVAPFAFANRTNLKGIYLPVGMRSIGSFAFLNCTSLEFLRVPPSITTIGATILSGAENAAIRGTVDSAVAEYAEENHYFLEYDSSLDFPVGDMNKNGKLNSSDVRILLRAVAGNITDYDEERYWSCDLKYDGVINTSDVRALLFESLYA